MAELALSFNSRLQESTHDAPIADLTVISGVREKGLDDDHVDRLVETGGAWPAILVWDAQKLVLDGAHRLAAAKRLGMVTIPAVRFCGSWQEAYVEAVRRNIAHGLPLTLKERTAAAQRVLKASPEWSDRRIAMICGLSAKTVARVRREAARTGDIATTDIRIGRDGRMRPVEAQGVRERIANALAEQPNSSLRAIAARVGASPETVRTVRRDLQRCDEASEPVAPEPFLRVLSLVAPSPSRESRDWSRDAALASTSGSDVFLRWFGATEVDEDWAGHVGAVPLSRVYEIADEARRRARVWKEFADALEARARPGRR